MSWETALANRAADIVIAGATQYLTTHNLKPVSSEALTSCCVAWLKIKLPEALHDAKEAMDCHMTDVATATFVATLMQAGIQAARECAAPPASFAA